MSKKLQIEELLSTCTDFSDAKQKLLAYDLQLKENDDLCLVFHKEPLKPDCSELEKECRSYIFDKKTLTTVCNQFPKIEYNQDAEKLLSTTPWANVTVQTCYEGTMIVVFFHNNNTYISTRRCLDAKESKWVKNMSHYDMFMETIQNKFDIDDLDKKLAHYFVLIHHKNKNIVSYEQTFGPEYKEIVHVASKQGNQTVQYSIKNTITPDEHKFDNLEALKTKLQQQDNVNFEGYVLKVYDSAEKTGDYRIFKMQGNTYQKIKVIRPNNSNLYQVYLELYQQDKLHDFLDYYPQYKKHVINRVSQSLKTISQEILFLYHATRNKKNPELYNNLKPHYKTILYNVHGLYLSRIPKTEDNKEIVVAESQIASINIHDVYQLLKTSAPNDLRNIFFERYKIITEYGSFRPFVRCSQTWAMTRAMMV